MSPEKGRPRASRWKLIDHASRYASDSAEFAERLLPRSIRFFGERDSNRAVDMKMVIAIRGGGGGGGGGTAKLCG